MSCANTSANPSANQKPDNLADPNNDPDNVADHHGHHHAHHHGHHHPDNNSDHDYLAAVTSPDHLGSHNFSAEHVEPYNSRADHDTDPGADRQPQWPPQRTADSTPDVETHHLGTHDFSADCDADLGAYRQPNIRSDLGANGTSDRGADRTSDRASDGASNRGANRQPNFLSDLGADRASNRSTHHLRAHHLHAVPPSDHLRAHHIISNRDTNHGASREPDVSSNLDTNSASDRNAHHFLSELGADRASNRSTHHLRAHHLRAVPAPDYIRAHHIIPDRNADSGADREPDLSSDRDANSASDRNAHHLRAHHLRAVPAPDNIRAHHLTTDQPPSSCANDGQLGDRNTNTATRCRLSSARRFSARMPVLAFHGLLQHRRHPAGGVYGGELPFELRVSRLP